MLADFPCQEAHVLIISDKASSESPGMGPTAACFLSQAASNLSEWFTRQCLLTGPHLREAEADLNLPKGKARQTMANGIRISGLGEAVKIKKLIILKSLSFPTNAISWPLGD